METVRALPHWLSLRWKIALLVTVACCASLQVQSVLYQTWAACRSFALTLLVLALLLLVYLAAIELVGRTAADGTPTPGSS